MMSNPKKPHAPGRSGKTPQVKKDRVIPERLTHKPFMDSDAMKKLSDQLYFAPKGEEFTSHKEAKRA